MRLYCQLHKEAGIQHRAIICLPATSTLACMIMISSSACMITISSSGLYDHPPPSHPLFYGFMLATITQLREAALVPSLGYPYIQFLDKDLTLC